jgi:hypothetical protein
MAWINFNWKQKLASLDLVLKKLFVVASLGIKSNRKVNLS